ncbi:MAG: prepilin-type N-terminal cleavage/methylation domain-containing protein [Planctomycetales bacterium]|nr:prepilin-type N-terminal cleavage/methylation domain-containing protein [Planctomycetales bacterium]
MPAKRYGYTLLELMVVVALLAIAVATATVKLVAPYRLAQAESVLEHLADVDRLARSLSKRSQGDIQLQVDGDTLYLTRNLGERIPSAVIELQPHFEFRRFRMLDGQNDSIVRFSNRGTSATYAIELLDRNDKRIWLAFLGLTGEALEIESEKEINELF